MLHMGLQQQTPVEEQLICRICFRVSSEPLQREVSLQQLTQTCPWPALSPPASTEDGAFPLLAHQLNFAAVTDSDNTLLRSNGHFVSGTKRICLWWKSTCAGLAAAARSCRRDSWRQGQDLAAGLGQHLPSWVRVLLAICTIRPKSLLASSQV